MAGCGRGRGRDGRPDAGGDRGRRHPVLVSWHSLSGRSNEDTTLLVRAIESNADYGKIFATVVIGGDFNASPADIETVVTSGTERTRSSSTYKHRGVVKSGEVSHPGSDNELDFFIVMSQTALTSSGSSASLRGVAMKAVTPSNHEPVGMKIFV